MGFIFSEKEFTLVSNIQISRFNLIIYNFCNWSASSTLISHYTIIFYRSLTCSSVVRLYSCRFPTCCSLGDLNGFTLVTYYGTELGYLEVSNLFCTWSSGWIHTCYILWYRARVFRRVDWRNYRRQLLGLVAGWLTCTSCCNCNWF